MHRCVFPSRGRQVESQAESSVPLGHGLEAGDGPLAGWRLCWAIACSRARSVDEIRFERSVPCLFHSDRGGLADLIVFRSSDRPDCPDAFCVCVRAAGSVVISFALFQIFQKIFGGGSIWSIARRENIYAQVWEKVL